MKPIPFKFGEIVTGQHFTNREVEITRLQSNFNSLQNTIIISPRRYGKSSLVREAAESFIKNEKGFVFCFLDLMYIYSVEEFYSQLATKILKASSNKLEEFLQLAKNVIKGARITINTGTGEPALELGINYIHDNIETILNLPQTIARRNKKKVIICIDEFQNISRFDHYEKLEGRLRAVWQHHQNVGYVLYGSKKTMMTEIFNSTSKPFYKFGEIIYLNRIQSDHLRKYVQHAFSSTGKEISVEIINRIIDTTENHPHYLQQFSRNIWLISGKRVTDNDFSGAKQALISENLNFYNEILDGLTNYQVSFLKALLNKEEQLYSMKIIQNYNLGSSANIRRLYNSFAKKGIIVKEADKIIFTDPIFKLIAKERFLL